MKIELKVEEIKIILTALMVMCGRPGNMGRVHLTSYDSPRYHFVLEHMIEELERAEREGQE